MNLTRSYRRANDRSERACRVWRAVLRLESASDKFFLARLGAAAVGETRPFPGRRHRCAPGTCFARSAFKCYGSVSVLAGVSEELRRRDRVEIARERTRFPPRLGPLAPTTPASVRTLARRSGHPVNPAQRHSLQQVLSNASYSRRPLSPARACRFTMSRPNARPLADPLNLHAKVQQQHQKAGPKASPPRAGPSAPSGTSSSTASGRSPGVSHLRQRSIGTSPSLPNFPGNLSASTSSHGHGVRSPFDDAHAAMMASASVPDGLNGLGILGQPTPHRAALMQSNASMTSLLDTDEGVARSQALAMRSERAEWVRLFVVPLAHNASSPFSDALDGQTGA